MVQILESNKKPSFMQRLGVGIERGVNRLYDEQQQKKAAAAEAENKRQLMQEQFGLKSGLERQKMLDKLALLEHLKGSGNKPYSQKLMESDGEDFAEKSGAPSEQEFDAENEGLSLVFPELARERRAAKETQEKRRLADRKEALAFHKESEKFDEKLTTQSEAAHKKLKAIEYQRKKQPEITNWDRFVSSAFKGSRWENLFKSSSAQQFDSAALPMMEGQKETFGVRLSDADLKLILQKIATADKSPEANKAILDYMELDEKLKIEKRKIADQIRKANKGLRPLDFESMVREQFNEKFGDQIESAAQKVMELPDNDRKREIVTGRKKVTPGTPLSEDVIDRYLDLAGGDWQKASEMAVEDGYKY